MLSVDSFAEKDSLISAPCLATKIYIPLSSSTKSFPSSLESGFLSSSFTGSASFRGTVPIVISTWMLSSSDFFLSTVSTPTSTVILSSFLSASAFSVVSTPTSTVIRSSLLSEDFVFFPKQGT